MCNAADTYTATSTTSTGVTVNWSYELNKNNNVVNLICTNVSSISGTVDIPSEIDGYTVLELGNTSSSWEKGTFEGCTGLTGVTIPNTITKIGANCFEGCVGLTNITIPNSITEICDEDVFKECTGLTSITIPDSVTRIGNYAFNGCTGLKTVTLGKNVTSIGNGAFNGCTGFKEITIPNSVTSIGAYAFRNCTGMANITLSNNLTKINRETFSGCKALTSVVIPNSVTTIDGYDGSIYGAFEDCTKLEKVLIPDSVATIEKSAFHNCPKLTIYGNDNQTSKQYAEDNNINFDYIANWNKVAVGDDITPPTIKSLEIPYGSAFKLDSGTGYYLVSAGTNISIKATFEEIIYGETAPKLTIKCGNGSNIELTNGVIQGSYIIYTYTIKDQDKGIITAVSMTGGDIKDETGNSVEKYICPELVTDIWDRYVYANGTKSNPTDQENNNSSVVTLSSITVTKTPTKNAYNEGESFDKSGMIITATYSDGSKKEITNYLVSPSGALKSTDTKVYITYTENGVTKAVEQKVTVTPKLTINNNTNNDSKNDNYKDDTEKDTTIKNDSKLPQTGTTLIILTIVSLIVVAVVSKVKCIKYKDI